jgi:hypothetical protein
MVFTRTSFSEACFFSEAHQSPRTPIATTIKMLRFMDPPNVSFPECQSKPSARSQHQAPPRMLRKVRPAKKRGVAPTDRPVSTRVDTSARSTEAERSNEVIDVGPGHVELLGRLRDIPARRFEGARDEAFLKATGSLLERRRSFWQWIIVSIGIGEEMPRLDLLDALPGRPDGRRLDGIGELAQVAVPLRVFDGTQGSGRQANGGETVLAARTGTEMHGQGRQVLAPLGERRHADGQDLQAIVEVFAKRLAR